jgi:hypothetical protein
MSMEDLLVALRIGGVGSLVVGAWLLLMLRMSPRFFLRHFPEEVRAVVPPLSPQERRTALLVGSPFLFALVAFPAWAAVEVNGAHAGDASVLTLVLAAFAAWTMLNLFDWLIVDELILGVASRVRPRWLILAGAEDVPLRIDHAYHAVGFAKGTLGGAVLSLLIGAAIAAFA